MTRRTSGGAAVLQAWLALACGVLASCNLIVGVGDYRVGETPDGTAGESEGGGGDDVGTGQTTDTGNDHVTSHDGQADVLNADANPEGSTADSRGDSPDAPPDANAVDVDAGQADVGIDVRPAEGGADASDAGAADAVEEAALPEAEAGPPEAAPPDTGAQEAEAPEAGPPVCGQGLPATADFAKLVSTCLYAVSCDPYFFDMNVSNCITYDYLESALSLSCLSRITSCNDFYTCQGWRYATTTECPTTSTSGTCVGGNAVDCTATPGIVTNCGQFGETCGTFSTTSGAGVSCIAPVSCTGTDSTFFCSSNYLYSCTNGVAYGQNCSTIQATCESVGTNTNCYYNAPSCSNLNTYSCAGGSLKWCSSAGQSLNYDCARAGLSCTIDSTNTGYCVAPGCTAPPPSTCTESCNGNMLSVCVGGAPYNIDCTQYGFTGCTTGTDSSNTTYAWCQ